MINEKNEERERRERYTALKLDYIRVLFILSKNTA